MCDSSVKYPSFFTHGASTHLRSNRVYYASSGERNMRYFSIFLSISLLLGACSPATSSSVRDERSGKTLACNIPEWGTFQTKEEATAYCERIPRDCFIEGKLFNSVSHYTRAECFRRAAIKFNDPALCDEERSTRWYQSDADFARGCRKEVKMFQEPPPPGLFR